MSKEQDEAKDVLGKVHAKQKKDFWKWMANTPVGLLAKGLAIFYTGASLLITSVTGVVLGHNGHLTVPHWTQYVITLAAAPVLIMASVMLGKFIIKAAKA